MPEYKWPEANDRDLIGKKISRLDGPAKVTGTAKYTYDINRPGMLFTRTLYCPHAHARIVSLDTTEASRMPGVKAVRVIQGVGTEIKWALDEIVAIAATSEEAAEDAIRAVKVEYEVLPHFVNAEAGEKAPDAKPAQEAVTGDPDGAKAAAAVIAKGYYGIPTISHCCMEAHGHVCEWTDDQHLNAWCSTQSVSGVPSQFAEGIEVSAANVRAFCDYMGGGFGSKFSIDRWGVECARLAREAKAPVKWMLEREPELTIAGDRPSAYAEIEVGASQDGTITYWASKSWGSGGLSGSGSPPLPYVIQPPNRRHQHISVPTHVASARAWRAPNHPQACFLTMCALDDLAAALNMDPLDFFMKNCDLTPRAAVYREELQKGAELIEWKRKWHPRGQSGPGSVKRGLGLSLHTWGGLGHNSNCEVSIHPDGSVEARLGSQDLGTGTRTVIGIVLAETLGLPLDAVKVSIGDSSFPASGASGGSTTVGGVSASTRRAALNALEQLFAKVAPDLGVTPDQLEAEQGTIRVKGDPSKSMPWKQAASRIGVTPITVRGANPGPGKLTDQGVGGIQMAEVAVDVETGVVRIEKMVAVQDCGLIIDRKTAESQVYGGLIMGISYALTEEKIIDPITGRMLNANMEFYKLPGIGDIGELVVHMMTGPEHDKRGVIGLGEPPVISPGAAISNAVANAIGVRVPYLPLTPDRVLAALEKGGMS
ncbi:MAG TPA: xanthine dehydrogenase family protein molybdopterin-binding subunit [Acidobacteriota bacterium]|nr:xanthine dehydrogenase family protein molybdopterin-binding subunit [Acidobacteriota bacterium]